MTHPPTSQARTSSAQVCRDRDWTAGDELVDAQDPSFRIRLTAIGQTEVLAVQLDADGTTDAEHLYELTCRDWQKA